MVVRRQVALNAPHDTTFRDPFHCVFTGSSGCQHTQLFLPTYQRANRLNSTKILRCFPHCCPDHIQRSYCGGALAVRVSGSEPLRAPSQLLVFARFIVSQSDYQGDRHTDQQPLDVGTCVRLDTIRASLQSSTNTNAEWIPSRLVHHENQSCTWTFELNASRRWYYGWRSGKNNSQRFTTHALEAIVMKVTSQETAEVVARTTSSSFTISSFRRCGQVTMEPSPPQLEDTRVAHAVDDFAPNDPRPSQPAHKISRNFTRKVRREKHDDFIEHIHDQPPMKHLPVELVDRHPFNTDRFNTTIGALFTSLERISVHTFAGLISIWSERRCASPRVVASINHHAAVAANFAFWLTNDKTVYTTFDTFVIQASPNLLDLEALRRQFDQWLRWLLVASERFLSAYGTSMRAMSAVVTSLLGVSDIHDFRYLHMFDWENFIASVRTSAITSSQQRRPRVIPLFSMSRVSGITGDWYCSLPSDIKSMHRSHSQNPLSVAVAFTFWQQLSHIRLQLDRTTRMLTIASRRGSSISSHASMRLVLDGQLRSFNILPHGESTLGAGVLLGGQCFGDYVGTCTDEGIIRLTCYSWSTVVWTRHTHQSDPHPVMEMAYRWNLQLASLDENVLDVNVLISVGSLSPKGCNNFASQTVRERQEKVSAWHKVYQTRIVYQKQRDEFTPYSLSSFPGTRY